MKTIHIAPFLIILIAASHLDYTHEKDYNEVANDDFEQDNRRVLSQTVSTATTGAFTVGTIATVSWVINTDDTVEFNLKLNQISWFSVGFGSTMRNCDMWVVEIANNEASVKDLWSTGQSTPRTDTTQDYTVTSQSVSGGKVDITFKRKLNTLDSSQDTTLVRSTTKTWCWAYRTSQLKMTSQHSNNGFGTVSIKFGVDNGSGTTTPPTLTTLTASQTKQTLTGGEFQVNTLATVNWALQTDDSVDFTVTLQKQCWFAVGFGSGMTNVDMFVVQIVNGQATVTDLWSTSNAIPSSDLQQSLTLISQTVASSSVTIKFNRKLNTGDTKDVILEKGQTYSWSWAYKSNELIMLNKHDQAAQIQIVFSTPDSSSSTTNTGLPTGGSFSANTLATVSWIFETIDTVTFTIKLTSKCWFGLGFSSGVQHIMTNVDMLVVEISGDVVQIKDLWSTGNSLPTTDTSQDVTIKSQQITGNNVEITFTRKLNTGDTNDKELVVGQTYTWGWAYNTAELTMTQKHTNTGSSIVKFGTANSQTTTPNQNDSENLPSKSDSSGNSKLGDNAQLFWKVTKDSIEFTLDLKLKCWFGIGFGKGVNFSYFYYRCRYGCSQFRWERSSNQRFLVNLRFDAIGRWLTRLHPRFLHPRSRQKYNYFQSKIKHWGFIRLSFVNWQDIQPWMGIQI